VQLRDLPGELLRGEIVHALAGQADGVFAAVIGQRVFNCQIARYQ
jgi:hypothetical protein